MENSIFLAIKVCIFSMVVQNLYVFGIGA